MEDKKKIVPNVDKLETRCIHISEMEKRAQKASRESIKYMQCLYMLERVGKVYKGLITSVADYGVFVEIQENKCDCLVKLSSIAGTRTADTSNHCIKEFNTGDTIRLGD